MRVTGAARLVRARGVGRAGVSGLASAAVLVLAAGCTGAQPAPAGQVSDFPMAPTPTDVRPAASCGGLRTTATPAAGGLPDIRLDCLGPGGAVSLARLRGPALVNVWGTWCGNCTDELPVLAAFARSTPSVAVVGVDYGEPSRYRGAAVAELSTSGVRYPSVVDPEERFAVAGVPTVPVTYFVDASGKVVFRTFVPYASVSAIRDDVREHLGVPAP